MTQTVLIAGPVNFRYKRKKSVAITAFVLFFLINCIVGVKRNRPIEFDGKEKMDLSASSRQIKVIGKTMSWWIAKWFCQAPRPPEIVIIGSSELCAIRDADGYVFNQVIDVADHPRSYLLEYYLHNIVGGNRKVMLASMPGMMLSDQLILSRALFSASRKPELVAIVVTPRDILDNVFGQPCRSEAFAFFSRYADLSPYQKIYNPEVRLDATYFVSFIPLRIVSRRWREPFNSICNDQTFANPFDRIHPNQIHVWNLPTGKCRNSFEQFKSRYARASAHKIDMQFRSLDYMLEHLQSCGIKVVVFNFPLAQSNLNLISKDFLKRYDAQITQICRKNNADYVDVYKTIRPFTTDEFFDTVHLNAKGGYRMSKTIALFVANKLSTKPFQQLLKDSDRCFQ